MGLPSIYSSLGGKNCQIYTISSDWYQMLFCGIFKLLKLVNLGLIFLCGFYMYMARMYSHAVSGKKIPPLFCFQSSLRTESGISAGQSGANLGGPEQTLRTVFSKVLVYFLPPASSCGKVMFSQACHSFCPQEGDVCLWIQEVNKRAIRILLECFLVC